MRAGTENKMIDLSALEARPADAAPRYRVPTGELDRAVYVRVLEDHGPVPVLDLRTWRRSPADVSEDAFRPTAAGVTLEVQYAGVLLEQIGRACGLVVTIAPAAVDQADGIAA